jgi:hypothetical protein
MVYNQYVNIGFLFETVIGLLICYVEPFEIGIGGRSIPSPHFIVPAMSYFTLIFFYDEVRKVFVRRGLQRIDKEGNVSKDGKQKQTGWIRRNTLY